MGRVAQLAATVVGLILVVAALVGFAALYGLVHGATDVTFGAGEIGLGLLVTLLATAVLVVAHEGIHGLAILAYGGRPTFGAGHTGFIPYFYATAEGQRFTRGQFVVVALAPTVVVTALCAVLVTLPFGGWLVPTSALLLGGCVGDWMLTWVAVRAPRGSLIEDRKAGVRIHPPAA